MQGSGQHPLNPERVCLCLCLIKLFLIRHYFLRDRHLEHSQLAACSCSYVGGINISIITLPFQ